MSSISIIGLGTMARALAARALAGGHAVEVVGRDAAKAKPGLLMVSLARHGVGDFNFSLGVNILV